ncbi:MAG: lytic transglycosylase domain-containing protein [Dokdonella sp.]
MQQHLTSVFAHGILLAVLLHGAAARADVVLYKCKDSQGRTAFADDPKKFSQCKAISKSGAFERKPPAPGSLAAQNGSQYREQPDVRAENSGATSTADMASAAPFVKPIGGIATIKASPAATGPRTTRGSVYTVKRKDGVVEYTNVKPRGGDFRLMFSYVFQETCYACNLKSSVDFAHTPLKVDMFRDEISAAALASGVDASLIRAVIHAESAFNPMALSAKGAQGLMQLMPGTALDLGVGDAFDAASNINGGAQYLAQMLKRFGGDETRATAAYNAGPGAVSKYNGVPPYAETQVYVQRVAQLRDRYRSAH